MFFISSNGCDSLDFVKYIFCIALDLEIYAQLLCPSELARKMTSTFYIRSNSPDGAYIILRHTTLHDLSSATKVVMYS